MKNRSVVITVILLLFIVFSVAIASGQKPKKEDQPSPSLALHTTPRQGNGNIGDVPTGQVPVQSEIVNVKLWMAAQNANETAQAIDRATQSGQMKMTKDVDAAMQKLRAALKQLDVAARCPVRGKESESLAVHGPAVHSDTARLQCTCYFMPGDCGCMMVVTPSCPVHGTDLGF